MRIRLTLAAIALAACTQQQPIPTLHVANLSRTDEVAQKDTLRFAATGTTEWLVDGVSTSNADIFKFTSTELGPHTIEARNDWQSQSFEVEVTPQFRHGMFVLNEGQLGKSSGSILFVSRQGVVEEQAAKLGNTSQDMFFTTDGKLYVVSQSGAKLLRLDAETLEREASFGALNAPNATRNPTNLAVLDPQNIFVRDNDGIKLFNSETNELKLVKGTSGASKNRMAVADGRVFAPCGRKVVVLAPNAEAAAQTIQFDATVTGVIAADDGNVWVAAGQRNKPHIIALIDSSTGEIIKQNELTEGSVS